MYIVGPLEFCLPQTPKCVMTQAEQERILPHTTFSGVRLADFQSQSRALTHIGCPLRMASSIFLTVKPASRMGQMWTMELDVKGDDAMFLLRCSEVQNLYVIIIHKS